MNIVIIIALALVVSIASNILFYKKLNNQNKRLADHIDLSSVKWADLATGQSGDLFIEKGFLTILQEQYILFCKKQADYGRNNVAVGGEKGLTIRLGDKVSRLFNLLGIGYGSTGSTKAPSVDEPVSETFIDVANYGTIGVMVVRGLWPRVRPEDVWSLPQVHGWCDNPGCTECKEDKLIEVTE